MVLAVHEDVLTIPVAAVVQTAEGDFCWVETAAGPQRRILDLGDSNDVFIVVNAGLQEGDEVVLNPTSFLEDAESEALLTQEGKSTGEQFDKDSREESEEGGVPQSSD